MAEMTASAMATTTPGIIPDDGPLIARARAGDSEAFTGLVDRHGGRLYTMLLRLSGNDCALAEDLLQEAFIRAWERLDQFDGRSAFGTWLYRLARNRALDLLERRRPGRLPEGHDAASTTPSPVEAVAGSDLSTAVHRALDTLPTATRELLLLREFQGLDQESLATLLGIPVGTVKSRLHRARADLKTALSAILGTDDWP